MMNKQRENVKFARKIKDYQCLRIRWNRATRIAAEWEQKAYFSSQMESAWNDSQALQCFQNCAHNVDNSVYGCLCLCSGTLNIYLEIFSCCIYNFLFMYVSLSHILATIRQCSTHPVGGTYNIRDGGRKGKNILNHVADGGRQKNTSAIVSALFVHFLFVSRLIIYFSLFHRSAADYSAISYARRGYMHL